MGFEAGILLSAITIELIIVTLFITIQNKTNMANLKEQIDAKFIEVGTSISNIAKDIQKLTEQGAGGLTKAEAEDVIAKLTVVSDGLKAVDDQTPNDETAPPTEEPA